MDRKNSSLSSPLLLQDNDGDDDNFQHVQKQQEQQLNKDNVAVWNESPSSFRNNKRLIWFGLYLVLDLLCCFVMFTPILSK